jgi:hypothetical protein
MPASLRGTGISSSTDSAAIVALDACLCRDGVQFVRVAHVMAAVAVPASGSTAACAKQAGSFSGSSTPVQRSDEKSTSPAVPSLNRSRLCQ